MQVITGAEDDTSGLQLVVLFPLRGEYVVCLLHRARETRIIIEIHGYFDPAVAMTWCVGIIVMQLEITFAEVSGCFWVQLGVIGCNGYKEPDSRTFGFPDLRTSPSIGAAQQNTALEVRHTQPPCAISACC